MALIKGVEFFSFENEVWYKSADGGHHRLTENDRSEICAMFDYIGDFYPEAFNALQEKYKRCSSNVSYYQYKIVWAFCKCNFGNIDNIDDIDSRGDMHFEYVQCPMRGECPYENVVCNPKFNSRISDAEKRVLELVFRNYTKEEIAQRLFLSIHTVNNHIRNAYKRIGVHEKADFIDYAHRHNLFEK